MKQLTGSWQKHVDFNYLSGEEFDEQVIELTVKEVVKEEAFDPNSKTKQSVVVLKFNETDKGIILNLTNSRTITKLLKTKNVEEWVGKKIPFWGKPDKRFGRVIRVKEDFSKVKIN